MEYKGKLYGKVGKSHFLLIETSEDIDNLKKRIAELETQSPPPSDVDSAGEYPIEFIAWYSGMEADKIKRAFERWKSEAPAPTSSAVSESEKGKENDLKKFAECYQPLFELMAGEHNTVLLNSEMDEIIVAAHAVQQNLRAYIEPTSSAADGTEDEEKYYDEELLKRLPTMQLSKGEGMFWRLMKIQIVAALKEYSTLRLKQDEAREVRVPSEEDREMQKNKMWMERPGEQISLDEYEKWFISEIKRLNAAK